MAKVPISRNDVAPLCFRYQGKRLIVSQHEGIAMFCRIDVVTEHSCLLQHSYPIVGSRIADAPDIYYHTEGHTIRDRQARQ